MRRLTFQLATLLMGLCLAAAGRAEQPAAGEHAAPPAGAKPAPQPYLVTLHGTEGEIEKKYDLSKIEDRQALFHDLEHGHVHELKQDVPPEIIPRRWDTGLWSIIIFVLLLAVLTKFAWKPMIQGLKKREDNIRGALEQAEQTRRQALDLQGQLDAKMRDAGAEIARLMDEARRDAQGVKEQMVAAAKDEIQNERDRLRREIEAAKDQALQEIWQQSVSLATAISAKVVRRSLSEEDHRRLLDESLAELKKSGEAGRRVH